MPAPLEILIVTPAPRGSLRGNRVTAERWGRLLGELGHHVQISEDYTAQPCDLAIALHARRSADACSRFRAAHPDRPLIVALTGTDLYEDIHVDADARRSLELADRLIVLHPRGADDLPPALRARVRPIVQSVEPPPPPASIEGQDGDLEVCVLGHLRPVKDPFRAAAAARLLHASSRIRIVHVGRALDEEMAAHAREEEASNPRYVWRGELTHAEALDVLARSRLHVLSSHMEGGANALCEAIACGVPTLTTPIAGSLGILGEDYPGTFPIGDTQALATLMQRVETESAFDAELRARCELLADLVTPARERAALGALLDELADTGER